MIVKFSLSFLDHFDIPTCYHTRKCDTERALDIMRSAPYRMNLGNGWTMSINTDFATDKEHKRYRDGQLNGYLFFVDNIIKHTNINIRIPEIVGKQTEITDTWVDEHEEWEELFNNESTELEQDIDSEQETQDEAATHL